MATVYAHWRDHHTGELLKEPYLNWTQKQLKGMIEIWNARVAGVEGYGSKDYYYASLEELLEAEEMDEQLKIKFS